jgi:hypothetical protein
MESCYQAKTSGNKLRRFSGVICSVEISNSVIVICSYYLYVVNKSNHQSKPRL